MRIVHFLKSREYSGAENMALSIMEMFRDEAECIYVSRDGDIRSVVEQRGFEFYALEKANTREIKKAIKYLQPDLIHAHDFTMSCLLCDICKNIPIVCHLHNNPPWLKTINPKSVKLFLSQRNMKSIIVVSAAVRDDFWGRKFWEYKISILPNVVDSQRIKCLSIQDNVGENFDIAFIGRLTEQKNPLGFIEIVDALVSEGKQIRAVMIGEGELFEQVSKCIEAKKLSRNIKLYGFTDNPYSVLYNSKILLMPSRYEGFGLVAVEAMIMGKPVVCGAVGGLTNIVDDNCGRCCVTNAEYIEELGWLLEDREYYNSKAKAAEEKAAIYTNAEAYKRAMSSIYGFNEQ